MYLNLCFSAAFFIRHYKYILFVCFTREARHVMKSNGKRAKRNPVAFQMIANFLWKCGDKELFLPFHSYLYEFMLCIPRQENCCSTENSSFSLKIHDMKALNFFRNFPSPFPPQMIRNWNLIEK